MTDPATTGTAAGVYLRGASYVLGEQVSDYTAIENLDELARRFGLASNPGLWGWGHIRRTSQDLAALAVAAGSGTLAAAGDWPASVDALVLCSTRVPGPAEDHGSLVASVLTGLGLGDLPCYGQSLNRCANLLGGLDVARSFVLSGRYQQVLVITTDQVAPGADRMSQFALFSDGAASCLVSATASPANAADALAGVPGQQPAAARAVGDDAPDAGPARAADPARYELVACATAQATGELDWSNQISSDLAREVNDQLLGPAGLKTGDLAALLHANLYKPLVMMKELQAGFATEQLWAGNIPRLGHCFAADPLINLVDRGALGHIAPGRYAELVTSVPGSRIGALLRRIS
jgi:3-oxoacyl-[acyl-carrier-protein] synthase-3